MTSMWYEDVPHQGINVGVSHPKLQFRLVTQMRVVDEETMTAAIYPGSFDPLTNGHLDIVCRGLSCFDKVIIGVADNRNKKHMFTLDERVAMVRECVSHLDPDLGSRVEIDTFDCLLVEYAKKKGVGVLLRGLRAVSDFEYEFQLASMNRKLKPDVETVFLMTSEAHHYISSGLVREVASFGGDVSSMVPAPVWENLKSKLASESS